VSDFYSFSKSLMSADRPGVAFEAFCHLTKQEFGFTLFTVLAYDKSGATVERVWSNMPGLFPTGSVSPVPDPASYEAGLKVINDREGIIDAFPHHNAILQAGCESSLALPVAAGGSFLGTLCFLHRAGHFTSETVEKAKEFIALGPAVFLLEEQLRAIHPHVHQGT